MQTQQQRPIENIKKFFFNSVESRTSSLEIQIPEVCLVVKYATKYKEYNHFLLLNTHLQLLQASYSFYTWPSASILAYFLWERRESLLNLNILELGAGTSLPGILAAKIGANVTVNLRYKFQILKTI